jgi:hypothetical protein
MKTKLRSEQRAKTTLPANGASQQQQRQSK